MNIPSPMKAVLALCIVLIIAAGFWLTDWQGKCATVKQLKVTCEGRKAESGNCRAMVRALPQENDRKLRLQRELGTVIQSELISENEIDFVPSAIADIESLVERQRARLGDEGFTISSLAPGSLQAGGGHPDGSAAEGARVLKEYATRTFEMSLTARYGTVIDFLRELGALRLKRLVTVNRLSLSPGGDAKPGQSPSLCIQMPITAYLRQGAL